MGTERLDKSWRERGLGVYSTEAILGTLRHYGVDIDEERLRQVPSKEQLLARVADWMQRWKGTGPFKDLPYPAALELWKRLGSQEAPRGGMEEEAGLPGSFHARLKAASLDEKLALAREAAAHPGFDGEEAFEIGNDLGVELDEAGRYPELEGVLDVWRERAPWIHDSEPSVLEWRVVLALRLPGRDVAAALTALAKVSSSVGPVLKLAEWCLYRGLVKEAHAGLSVAWSGVMDDEVLFGWVLEESAIRTMLTVVDAALVDEPDLSAEQLRERLSPFDELELDPRWIPDAVRLRTGREVWKGSSELLAGLSPEEMGTELRALTMALESELLSRHGWPRGRTQLVHPGLVELLPGPPTKQLLPDLDALEQWAKEHPDDRYFHPHVHAATALALLPWGDFLLRLGLVEGAELAAWRAGVPKALEAFPESLEQVTDDPALAEEVRQGLLGG